MPLSRQILTVSLAALRHVQQSSKTKCKRERLIVILLYMEKPGTPWATLKVCLASAVVSILSSDATK